MTFPIPTSAAPLLSFRAASRALSSGRLRAYSLPEDTDSTDAIARYLWNVQIASALLPILHLVEVTFRNTLFLYGERAIAGRAVTYRHGIACWLDAMAPRKLGAPADPILERKEAEDVASAVMRLGPDPRRHTAGHLVGQLSFGFWVRCCNRPYDHGNTHGPRLWPDALKGFQGAPKAKQYRAEIQLAFAAVCEMRNRVAHHQPIWDRDPIGVADHAITLIGWMNSQASRAARHCSLVESLVRGGPSTLRPLAASMMKI